MSYKVFISHSSVDTWVAKQIARNIHDCGGQTFLDAFDINVGDEFESKITQGIESSQELVVLFSKRALASDYVTSEIALAHQAKLRICSVLYDVEPDKVKNKPFIDRKAFVQINDLDIYFQQLKTRIDSI